MNSIHGKSFIQRFPYKLFYMISCFSIRLPLFISAGFALCHIFSVYLPVLEINVEVIDDNRPEEEEEDEEEYSLDSGEEEEDSEADLAVVVEIVGDRQRE